MMKRNVFASIALCLAMLFALTACGEKEPDSEVEQEVVVSPEPSPEPEPEPEPDPYEAVMNYWSNDQLTQAWGPDQVVEHVFFHPVIAYPAWAFQDGPVSQKDKEGLDDWMLTVDEYNQILQSI